MIPDLSEFNDPPYRANWVDWGVLNREFQAGTIEAVGIRAGFGTVRADQSFERNRQAARTFGIPRFYYWFNYPSYNAPEQEAEFFNATVGPLEPLEAMVGDFENDPNARPWPTGNAALMWAHTFMSTTRSPQNASWWYGSPSFVESMGLSELGQLWGFWVAHYGVAVPDGAGANPFLWQQTSSATVPGVSGPCDNSVLLRGPLGHWFTPPIPVPPTAHPGLHDRQEQES